MSKKDIPIAVLDEHPNWLNPLYEEFTKRGLRYVKIDISATTYDPTETTVLPFYINRLSPSASKRKHEQALPFAQSYIRYLEDLGARVVNGSHTLLLETSKAHQAALFRKLGILQPKVRVFSTISQITEYLGEFTFPVVIKPNTGGSGLHIRKFETKDELCGAIANNEILLPSDGLVLLQEFIQPKDGYIVRVETINKKVVYAMKVFTKETFNLCPSNGCDLQRSGSAGSEELGYCVATPGEDVRFELFDALPESIIASTEKIVQEANLECGGIEYVIDHKDTWYAYDINALSILRSSFKDEYNIDGWGMLADYFIGEYKKAVEK